jgi:KH domain
MWHFMHAFWCFRRCKPIDNILHALISLCNCRLGAIVGHRGEVVRRISADTGVRIYIPGMITRDGAQNGAPNVHLEGESEHVFLALAFILEAVYNIKPSLTADGIATVKQRQTTTPTVGSGNNHSQQQQQQHADSSKSSEQLQQQQSNGQKQTAKGRNSPTSAAAVTTATESDSTKGATRDKQEPGSSSETGAAVDTTPAQDTIVIPSDKVTDTAIYTYIC